MAELFDVVIVGAGPGGLCAALYCTRAGLTSVILDRGPAGGQINNTEAVENYLGIIHSEGPELAQKMTEHVAALGIEVTYANVEKVTREEDGAFTVHTDGDDEFRGRACIYCAGSHPRYLGVPGEQEYRTGGVSYCATCDGFFYKGKDVVVVGGGDAAIEESIYLTKIVNTVRCVHRRDELRAQQVLQDRAFEKENFGVTWHSIVEEIVGENGRVTGVRLLNKKTGERTLVSCDGVFIYVGNLPNSEAVRDLVDTDENGYVVVDHLMRSSVPGLYAIGDVRIDSVRQIASAVGDGATAAVAAVAYVNAQG